MLFARAPGTHIARCRRPSKRSKPYSCEGCPGHKELKELSAQSNLKSNHQLSRRQAMMKCDAEVIHLIRNIDPATILNLLAWLPSCLPSVLVGLARARFTACVLCLHVVTLTCVLFGGTTCRTLLV